MFLAFRTVERGWPQTELVPGSFEFFHDLTWGAQVDAAVDKANRILGIVYRTIGPTNQETCSILYITLVRPILEYAAPVWCPYLVKDVLATEKVQRRASRLTLGQKRGEMEYGERIKILNWPTLEKRRHFISLIECLNSPKFFRTRPK